MLLRGDLRGHSIPLPDKHGIAVAEEAVALINGCLIRGHDVLAPGKRTVTAALRITGRATASNFTCYHQVLNRARWSAGAMARRLLALIVARLVADGPVVIGVDDTIERRWGPKIAARGIYRDPVRSSHAHFVKTSGLRWLSFIPAYSSKSALGSCVRPKSL
jgi:hypothetical protein